jgi:hypothetical protein
LALRTYTSGEYRFVAGQLKRSKKVLAVRGLNDPATLCCTSITL